MERITTSWHQPLTLLPPPSSKRGAARHPAEQLGALSLCYVFQTEYRVGMASLPPDSSLHLAILRTSPTALLTERSSEAPSQTGGSSYRAGLYSLAWRLAIVERNTMYKNHPVRPSKCRGNSPCKMVDQWMISCLTLDINTCV